MLFSCKTKEKEYIIMTSLFIVLLTMGTIIPLYTGTILNSRIETTYNHSSVHRPILRLKTSSITGTVPPSSGNWNISDVTTIENENLIINASIFIKKGGALVLKNTTIYMNLNSDGEYWIEALNGGKMTIINSKITSYNIYNNYYIKVDKGSKFYMENSEISYAGYTWGSNGDKTGLWINTDNVTIVGSTISNNYYGVRIYDSSNVTIANNTISNNNWHGVHIYGSSNVIMTGNALLNNTIYVDGSEDQLASYSIDESNTINGYPIRYLFNVSSININGGTWGEFIIAYSHNINIFNVNTFGMQILYSHNMTISGSTILNYNGVIIETSNNIIIINSTIYNNNYNSKNFDFSSGAYIWHSNVTITQCNFVNYNRALYIRDYSNVLIYLNNFINNKNPPIDEGNTSFDNGVYGNYWDNYNGTDANGDLIGDTPYQIDDDSIDNYPLMAPVRSYNSSIYYIVSNSNTSPGTDLFKIKIVYNTTNVEPVYILYYVHGTQHHVEALFNSTTNTYDAEIPEAYADTFELLMGIPLQDIPPTINEVTWSPQSPTTSQSITVYANVTDDVGITSVILSYYDGLWYNVTMALNNGVYQAVIPPHTANTTVIFKIYVEDTYGHWAVSNEYQVTFSNPQGSGGLINIGSQTIIIITVISVAGIASMYVFLLKRKK